MAKWCSKLRCLHPFSARSKSGYARANPAFAEAAASPKCTASLNEQDSTTHRSFWFLSFSVVFSVVLPAFDLPKKTVHKFQKEPEPNEPHLKNFRLVSTLQPSLCSTYCCKQRSSTSLAISEHKEAIKTPAIVSPAPIGLKPGFEQGAATSDTSSWQNICHKDFKHHQTEFSLLNMHDVIYHMTYSYEVWTQL